MFEVRAGVPTTATFLSLALLVAGCGESRVEPGSVRGTVTLDGRPLAFGVIRFRLADDAEAPVASGQIIGGRFELPAVRGPAVGDHRVEIGPLTREELERQGEHALEELQAAGVRRIELIDVPARYDERSDLKVTVVPGDGNEFAFDLTSTP